eukprot:UC4_evm1s1246
MWAPLQQPRPFEQTKGNSSGLDYPLDPASLTFFYWVEGLLPPQLLELILPPSPSAGGQLYSFKAWTEYYHVGEKDVLRSGYKNDTAVEVTHACCDLSHSGGKTSGFWLYAVNWANADDAVLSTIADAARKQGLDSLQFSHRIECIYLFEILDLRDREPKRYPNACPGASAAKLFSSGAKGEKPC